MWEIFCCIGQDDVSLHIRLPNTERQSLRSAIITNHDSVLNTLVKVHAQRAEAWNPKDKEMIFFAIENSIGFSRLNQAVKNQMRQWCIGQVTSFVESTQSSLTSTRATKTSSTKTDLSIDDILLREHAALLDHAGVVFMTFGNVSRAVEYFEWSLKQWKQICDDSTTVIPVDVSKLEAHNLSSLNICSTSQNSLGDVTVLVSETTVPRDQGETAEPQHTARYCMPLKHVLENSVVANSSTGRRSTLSNCSKCDRIGSTISYESIEKQLSVSTHSPKSNYEATTRQNPASCSTNTNKNIYDTAPHLLMAETLDNTGIAFTYLQQHDKAIELLSRALAFRISLLSVNHEDVARSYGNLGKAHMKGNNFDLAFSYFEKSLAIQIELFGKEHVDVSSTLHNMGVLFHDKLDYDSAMRTLDRALKIANSTLGCRHPGTACTLALLGDIYRDQNMYDEAIDCLKKATETFEETLGEFNSSTAAAYSNLGQVFCDLNQAKSAIVHFEKALRIYDSLPDSLEHVMLKCSSQLAMALHINGENDRALRICDDALCNYADMLKIQDADIPGLYATLSTTYFISGNHVQSSKLAVHGTLVAEKGIHQSDDTSILTASIFRDIGWALNEVGNTTMSISLLTKAAHCFMKMKNQDNSSAKNALNLFAELAKMHESRRQYKSALSCYESIQEIETATLIPSVSHSDIINTHHHMATIFTSLHRYEEAVLQYEHAIKIQHDVHGDNGIQSAKLYTDFGMLYFHANQYSHAIPLLTKAFVALTNCSPTDIICKDAAICANHIGVAHMNMGDYHSSKTWFQICLDLSRPLRFLETKCMQAEIYNKLGKTCQYLEQLEEAVKFFSEAVEFQLETAGSEDVNTAIAWHNLADAQKEMGYIDEAIEGYVNALELRRMVLGMTNTDTLETMERLAQAYEQHKMYDKSEKVYEELLHTYQEQKDAVESAKITETYGSLAFICMNQNKYECAVAHTKEQIELLLPLLDENSEEISERYTFLALLYDCLDDWQQSVVYHEKVLSIRKKLFGLYHPSTLETTEYLVSLYFENKRYENAIPHLQSAICIYEDRMDILQEGSETDEKCKLFAFLRDVGFAYESLDLLPDAIRSYSRALEIANESVNISVRDIIYIHHHFGKVHLQLKEPKQALKYFVAALQFCTNADFSKQGNIVSSGSDDHSPQSSLPKLTASQEVPITLKINQESSQNDDSHTKHQQAHDLSVEPSTYSLGSMTEDSSQAYLALEAAILETERIVSCSNNNTSRIENTDACAGAVGFQDVSSDSLYICAARACLSMGKLTDTIAYLERVQLIRDESLISPALLYSQTKIQGLLVTAGEIIMCQRNELCSNSMAEAVYFPLDKINETNHDCEACCECPIKPLTNEQDDAGIAFQSDKIGTAPYEYPSERSGKDHYKKNAALVCNHTYTNGTSWACCSNCVLL